MKVWIKAAQAFTTGVEAHSRKIIAFYLLLFLVSSFFAFRLFANLKPDIEELLPTTSRSVLDLNQVTSRLRSVDSLSILIFSKDGKAAGRFQSDLARALKSLPPAVSSGVEYSIAEELNFFKNRKALFIDLQDLKDIDRFIKARIEYEKSLYNPLNLVSREEIPEPKYDFKQLERKVMGQAAGYADLPAGIYSNPEGTIRLILVYSPSQSIVVAQKLRKEVDHQIAQLNPTTYSPDLEIKFSGNVQDIIEEQTALLEDLVLSTVLVMVLVALALALYFRTVIGTMIIVLALLVGTVITFGLSFFAVGYLNANSAFLGSIVMGNGINFGIMVLARYLEERQVKATPHHDAFFAAIFGTMPATLTAALAAGLAYGSLGVTQFRGFSQFGVIGFIGMVACWITSYTLLPALISLWNRRRPGGFPVVEKKSQAGVFGKVTLILSKPLAAMGILATVASLFFISKIDRSLIESDLSKLRDKKSMTEGSGYLTKYADEILKRETSPMVILAKTQEQADRIAQELEDEKKREGPGSLIAQIITLKNFVPEQQKEKIEVLQSMRRTLRPSIVWRLSETDKSRVKDFLSETSLKPFAIEQLPPKLLDRFREKSGTIGPLVLVEPPLTRETKDGQKLIRLVSQLREAADHVGEHIPVAGRLPVSADMFQAILDQGPVATLISFIAVFLLTIILFRNRLMIFLVVGSLVGGVLWMLGWMQAFDLKINFLNFIALPITFGIGVDYAVNVFSRYQEELGLGKAPRKALLIACDQTGGAVFLASVTTIIGWASLLIAGNQAFVSFGRLAVIGEITCLVFALLVMPAFLLVFKPQR